jgi:hypothetical protein
MPAFGGRITVRPLTIFAYMNEKPETLIELSERVDALESELESVEADAHQQIEELEAKLETYQSKMQSIYEELSLKIRRLQK